MTEAAAAPFRRHNDNSVFTLLLCMLVTVLTIAFLAQKRKPAENSVPHTTEELQFSRERRAQTLLNKSGIKAAIGDNEDQKEGEGEEHSLENNKKERNAQPEVPKSGSSQTTTEEDLTATAAAIPHETANEPHIVAAMKSKFTLDVKSPQEAKTGTAYKGNNTATIDDIDGKRITLSQQGDKPSITTSKKHQVSDTSDEKDSKKMRAEKLGSTT
jgi:hypothetical protein